MIEQSIDLKAGLTIKNRIAKSALSEQLSDARHNPTQGLIDLYERWAKGGAGLLITGEKRCNVELIIELIG